MKLIQYIKKEGDKITVQSLSTKQIYILTFNPGKNEWRCSCPHSIFRNVKNCKHIKAFLAGELSEPPEETKVDEFS